MHFWIDKRQGCGISGRRQVPPSLSGYGRNLRHCGAFDPKPMVTPVHRFQSIESVANNSLRYARSSGYHSRVPAHYHPPVTYNDSTGSVRHPQMDGSIELINTGNTTTSRNTNTPLSKFKCGVWMFFAIATFSLARYYFHGVEGVGLEAFAFCSLLVVILIIGGLLSLYEAITATARNATACETIPITPQMDQSEEEAHNQVPTSLMPPGSAEMPPPAYHIAIMLPSHNDTEMVQIIRDSPPPSYEKAVT